MKEEGVVAIHLPIGSLKTRSGLEPVPKCEPSTYQPISRFCIHSQYNTSWILRNSENIITFLLPQVDGVRFNQFPPSPRGSRVCSQRSEI